MKKLIIWLVSRYNKKATPEDQIEVVTPDTFSAKITTRITASHFKTEFEKQFLQNMINEKKYDLREQLINQLNKSSFIKEEVEIKEKTISIKLQIKAFSYEG